MILEGHLLSEDIEFSNCPFCGAEPVVTQIGNETSKKRTVEVQCSGCRVKMSQSALTNTVEWLQMKMEHRWNRRY